MSSLAPLEILSTYWRFIKDGREARCVLLPHPSGLELRYLFNGMVLMGVVADSEDGLRERARQWRLRLVAEGWEEIAQLGQLAQLRSASVPSSSVNVRSGTRSHSGR
jgi:hypothetical protein